MPLSAAIFRRGGPKRELFHDGTDVVPPSEEVDDEKELDGKLKEVRELLAADKSGKDMSAAIWRPQLRLAELVLTRKNTGQNMGFQQGRKMYLHIEEAVFLVDRTDLLLFVEDAGRQRLLSLQEAYELMMVDCPGGIEAYILFTFLLRCGYIVRRHPTRWILEPSEDPSTIWCRGAWRDETIDRRDAATATATAMECCSTSECNRQLAVFSASSQHQRDDGGGGASAQQVSGQPQFQRPWWRKADARHPLLTGVPQSFLDDLPGVPTPVPHPGEMLRSRFPRLKPFGAPPPDTELGPLSSAAYLMFDVYKPGSHIGRRVRSFPPIAFHLCLSRGAPPTLQDMRAADAQAAAAAVAAVASCGASAAAPLQPAAASSAAIATADAQMTTATARETVAVAGAVAAGLADAGALAGGTAVGNDGHPFAKPFGRGPKPAPIKYAKIESGDITFYGISKMTMLELI